MCQDCADLEHAKTVVDPSDFGDIDMDVLEDESAAYDLAPGAVFGGVIRLLGTFAHVSLIKCEWRSLPGGPLMAVTDEKLQRLVDAALSADPDAYSLDREEPKWVKLAAWPGNLYLLAFAPGAA